MLAGLDEDRQRLSILHHDPIGAEIRPIGLRIAHDDQAFGPDIVAAITFVPERRGKAEAVNRIACHMVLVEWPRLDHDRVNWLRGFLLGLLAIVDERLEIDIAHHQLRRAHVAQDAVARVAALNTLEQEHWRVELLLAHLVDRANLEMRVGLGHAHQFALLLHDLDEGSQVAERSLVLVVVEAHE